MQKFMDDHPWMTFFIAMAAIDAAVTVIRGRDCPDPTLHPDGTRVTLLPRFKIERGASTYVGSVPPWGRGGRGGGGGPPPDDRQDPRCSAGWFWDDTAGSCAPPMPPWPIGPRS